MANLNLWKHKVPTTTITVVITEKKNKSECKENSKNHQFCIALTKQVCLCKNYFIYLPLWHLRLLRVIKMNW